MKQVLLFLAIFICSVTYAQTNVFKKIGQRHDIYQSSNWQGVDSFRWAYNANAFLTEQTRLKADASNNWNNVFRYLYTLDANDSVTTQIRENWVSGGWLPVNRYTYFRNLNGNLLTVNYDIWNGSAWSQYSKIEYAGYNSLNNFSLETVYTYNGGSWMNNSKRVFQYYANEYQVQFLEEYIWNTSLNHWDSIDRFYYTYNQDSIGSITKVVPFQGVWFLNSKEINTYSTSPFVKTSKVIQKYDTTQFVDEYRTLYTHNAMQKLEKEEYEKYIAGFGWLSQWRTNYLYNSDTLLKEYYKEAYAGGWSNDSRNLLTYTGKNLTEQISYTGSGSLWYESKKTNYTYDANDLNIYRQIDTFDGANFFPNNRDFYYYNSFTVNTQSFLKYVDQSVLYPNPANQQINLKLTSQRHFHANIQVFDLLGKCKLIISQPVEAGENLIPIPINSLSPGNYFIRMMDHENRVQLTENFQVN